MKQSFAPVLTDSRPPSRDRSTDIHHQAQALIKKPEVGPVTPARRDHTHFGESLADSRNDPDRLSTTPGLLMERRYALLKKRADLSPLWWGPRTGNALRSWSYAQGGIARPNTGQCESAVVKADKVFNRGLGFPATRYELAAHSPATDPKNWYGHCDGVAACRAMLPKPKRPVDFWVQDARGGFEPVHFSVEDIDAVVSEALVQMPRSTTGTLVRDYDLAEKVDASGRPRSERYRDVNPGTYHILRANLLGRENRVFIADVATGSEVQNQPVYAYDATRERFVVASEAQRLVSGGVAGPYTHNPNARQFVHVRSPELRSEGIHTLEYVLELDGAGSIIGGEWVGASRFDHPDMVWVPRPERIAAQRAELPNSPSNNPGIQLEDALYLLRLSLGIRSGSSLSLSRG